MATPRADSYTADSGAAVYGGRTKPPLALGNRRISIWGQSNALGRADRSDISATPLSADAGLADFDAGTFDRVYIRNASNVYQKLTPSTYNGADAGQFGAEFGLAVRWTRETASGLLFIEKEASSGVSIDPQFIPPGWPYSGTVTRRATANNWLASNGITLAGESWLWVQGESDYLQAQSWYQSRLEALMAGRVADGLSPAGTVSLLVQMAAGSAQYGAGVVAAKAAVAAANPATVKTMPAPYYMKADNLHQNGRGQVQMGYNAFSIFFGADQINT